MVGRAQERGHLKAGWVAADDAFGIRRPSGRAWRPWGCGTLDVPSGFTVWPPEPAWTSAEYQGFGRPRKPRLRDGSAGPWSSAATSCRRRPGVRLRWPREARGHAATFLAPRGCDRPAGEPGEIHWAVYRRNRDGSEPRYYLSNAPEDTPLETLAYVGGSRWRIETEFETGKAT